MSREFDEALKAVGTLAPQDEVLQQNDGEWEVEAYSDGWGVSRVVYDDLEPICLMTHIDDAKQLANFIAAAPKMLKALELANQHGAFFPMEVDRVVKAALEAAKGE